MTATADIQPPLRPLYVGATVTRAGDDKLLRGEDLFVSDVRLHNAVEMAIVRSPFAHAEIVSIDVAEARALPGVIGVWAAGDLHGISPFPDFAAMAETGGDVALGYHEGQVCGHAGGGRRRRGSLHRRGRR